VSKRYAHWLRGNPKTEIPTHWLFWHVESTMCDARTGEAVCEVTNNPGVGLKRIGVPSGDERMLFTGGAACLCTFDAEAGLTQARWFDMADLVTFWRTVLGTIGKGEHLWCVSQGAGVGVRLARAFEVIPSLGWKGKRLIPSSTCLFVEFGKGRSKIKFVDSQNLWRNTLPELAIAQGEDWEDLDVIAPGDARVQEHCTRAVRVLMQTWGKHFRFLLDNDMGRFAWSLASQASNAYRHRFMPCQIGVHDDSEVLAIERLALHGGRCEVFALGEFEGDSFYSLDINAAYPYVMSRYVYPRKLSIRGSAYYPPVLTELLDYQCLVADVILDTETRAYPLKLGRRTIYPCGVFRTVLTTPELRLALQENTVKAVGRVFIYEPADLFSDYVSFVLDKRKEFHDLGDVLWEGQMKRYANVLWGKMSQRGYSQKILHDCPVGENWARQGYNVDTGCLEWTMAFGGRVIHEVQTEESPDSCPAIGAHVTAHLRMMLWDMIQVAGEENCYMTDTDALTVNQAGYERLKDEITPGQAGSLKVEAQGDNLKLWARKWYEIGGELTTAGVKDSAVRIAPTRFVQRETQSLRAALQRGNVADVLTGWATKSHRWGGGASPIDARGRVLPVRLSIPPTEIVRLSTIREKSLSQRWWIDRDWLASIEDPFQKYRAPELELHLFALGERDAAGESTPLPPGKVVCSVNGKSYASLDEAFEAAAVGESGGGDAIERLPRKHHPPEPETRLFSDRKSYVELSDAFEAAMHAER